jgi:hypothetical protein
MNRQQGVHVARQKFTKLDLFSCKFHAEVNPLLSLREFCKVRTISRNHERGSLGAGNDI